MFSSIFSSDFRRYLGFLALFGIPLLLLLNLNYFFLRNARELLSIPEILALQRNAREFCLYGTALHADTFRYKLEGYRLNDPQIIAMGSSRALQFRERFFSKSFFNLGSSMTNLREGTDVTEGILQSPHKPEVVIFGVDFWWFGKSFEPPVPYRPRQEPIRQFEGYFLFKPFQWIKEGKLTLSDYIQTIVHPDRGGPCNIGISALKRRDGFGPDGSMYYSMIPVPPSSDSPEDSFPEVAQIRSGEGRFAYEEKADPLHMETFLYIIDRLRSDGIEVIVILPPVAPPVFKALQENEEQYGILNDLRSRLTAANIFFLDATDPSSLNSTACEFIDGIHGGDVTYARMILLLDEKRRRAGLSPVGKTAALLQMVKENAGLSMARDIRVTAEQETDFLRMGCKKH